MTALLAALAVAVALAAGYALGRIRPRARLEDWTWEQMTFGAPWAAPLPRQVVVFVALCLLQPGRALDAVRRRNEPPPEPPRRSPAVLIPRAHHDTQQPEAGEDRPE